MELTISFSPMEDTEDDDAMPLGDNEDEDATRKRLKPLRRFFTCTFICP